VPAVPDPALHRALRRTRLEAGVSQDVSDATRVLEGRNDEVVVDLRRRMDAASECLKFEEAARLRDQIAMLKEIQASQSVSRIAGQDIDAVALSGTGRDCCVAVVFLRGGRNLGSTNYFMKGGWAARARHWVHSSSSTTWRVKHRPKSREPSGRGCRPRRGGVDRAQPPRVQISRTYAAPVHAGSLWPARMRTWGSR